MSNPSCQCGRPLDSSDHCVCGHPNPIPSFDDYPSVRMRGDCVDFREYDATAQSQARRAEATLGPATAPADNEGETAEPQDQPISSDNTAAPVPSTSTLTITPTLTNVSEGVSATPHSTQLPNEAPNLDEQVPNRDEQRDLDRRTPFQVVIQQLAALFDVRQTTWLVLTGFGQLMWPLLAITRRIQNAFARRGEGEAPAP